MKVLADDLQAHYETLVRIIAQLRDGHAYVKAANGVDVKWPIRHFDVHDLGVSRMDSVDLIVDLVIERAGGAPRKSGG